FTFYSSFIIFYFFVFFFFFNDTATTEIYTLSLHDALPISIPNSFFSPYESLGPSALHPVNDFHIGGNGQPQPSIVYAATVVRVVDRKSTRLNSSHVAISYAVFCLKKKKKKKKNE